ncbi:hypothetical protein CLU79DRAFT_837768 [Phycomyces nitens]|nr:hypothetical protein CLU79DRAFT_837768 [Phycomyces nitens]
MNNTDTNAFHQDTNEKMLPWRIGDDTNLFYILISDGGKQLKKYLCGRKDKNVSGTAKYDVIEDCYQEFFYQDDERSVLDIEKILEFLLTNEFCESYEKWVQNEEDDDDDERVSESLDSSSSSDAKRSLGQKRTLGMDEIREEFKKRPLAQKGTLEMAKLGEEFNKRSQKDITAFGEVARQYQEKLVADQQAWEKEAVKKLALDRELQEKEMAALDEDRMRRLKKDIIFEMAKMFSWSEERVIKELKTIDIF